MKTVADKGHQTYYASMGPISSNWDRACELYAQIKGTVVDYGQAHSAKYGHARYGKDYRGKGFYPAWDG
jgi:triacylglycerol lipase